MAKIYDFVTKNVLFDSEKELEKLGKNYKKWDLTSLEQDLVRFHYERSKNKKITKELLDWGIPLFTELCKRTNLPDRLESYNIILKSLIADSRKAG